MAEHFAAFSTVQGKEGPGLGQLERVELRVLGESLGKLLLNAFVVKAFILELQFLLCD